MIEHDIIIAPHTVYDCPTGKLSEAIASSLDHNLPDDPTVLFVNLMWSLVLLLLSLSVVSLKQMAHLSHLLMIREQGT